MSYSALIKTLACCLFGAGLTDDLNQAKAIVAVETHTKNGRPLAA